MKHDNLIMKIDKKCSDEINFFTVTGSHVFSKQDI